MLPALRSHRFGRLYKPIEVRQAAVRHSFLDFEDSRTDVQLEQVAIDPLCDHLPLENGGRSVAMRAIAIVTMSMPAPAFMLRHLRLGGSRSSPPDPLIV